MCGRYVDPNLRGTEFELSELRIDPFPRRYNVKPTQDVLIFCSDAGLAMMARWWLIPSWHKRDLKDWKATTFNARIEDAAGKPTFRGAWRYGRCLIPAGGYFEWTGPKGAKQPHFIHSAGNEQTLWFAGLMSIWQDLRTCSILTRAANETTDSIHHRMPVVLNAEEREAWLSGAEGMNFGEGARLTHFPVARFGLKDDGPELIEPA